MVSIVLGPPGTGKTTTLLSMIEESLNRGVAPDRIALVTFTRRGADEARTRAMKKFRLTYDQLPYFSTLHGMCYRQLGLSKSDILTGPVFFEFANYARIRVTGRAWSDDGLFSGFEEGDRILFMENLARIRQITLRQQYEIDHDFLNWNEVSRVSKALAVFKASRGIMDFTDMLGEFVRHDRGLPIEELYVDESQDLSSLQWSVVNLLARGADKVTVAGDDDQAIYRWAGADVEHLISMEGDARVLGQSYRVPLVIQKLANSIIGGVVNRRPKTWKPKKGKGEIVRGHSFDDVEIDSPDTLILVRNAYVAKDQVEPSLRRAGIIYEMNGTSSIKTGILRSISSWEELRRGIHPITLGEARQMYEYIGVVKKTDAAEGVRYGFKALPSFGDDNDSPVTMRDLIDSGGLTVNPEKVWHDALNKLPADEMSYMLAARRRGEKLRGDHPRVRISTIHSAKGGEAEHVVVMKEMAKRSFVEMSKNMDDERRVWYVGITRAKQKLTIVKSETKQECPWI